MPEAIERIAIIADIHANIYALESFLKWLKNNEPGIDRIINLGDFLQIGTHNREVLKIVLEDRRFINILGNNEDSLLWRKPENFSKGEIEHQDWVLKQVCDKVGAIKAIPVEQILEIGKYQLILNHRLGSDLYFGGQPISELAKEQGSEQIILSGHTHWQANINFKNLKLINPGSLGFSGEQVKNGLASFCLADIYENHLDLQFKYIPFNLEALFKEFKARKVPDCDKIMAMFFR